MRIKEATKDARVKTAYGLGTIQGTVDGKLIDVRLDVPIAGKAGKTASRIQVRPQSAQLVLTGIAFEAQELATGRGLRKLVAEGRRQGVAFAAAQLLLRKDKTVPKNKLLADVEKNFPLMLPFLTGKKIDAAAVTERINLTRWVHQLQLRDELRRRLMADGVEVTAKAEHLRCRVPDRSGKLHTLYVDDVTDILIDKNKLVACALRYWGFREDADDVRHVYMHRAPEGHMVLNIN